jgi:transcription-repair coupling factor (superfamily II helicase)
VAIRGGVIDIFPGGRSRPVRLELDGALLTAIRVYDPVTQRTTESIPELEVDAVSELPPADDAESLRPHWAERRLPEACPEFAALFDYLPDAALVEASDAAAARSAFLEQLREARDGYARSEPQRGLSGPDRLYLLEED